MVVVFSLQTNLHTHSSIPQHHFSTSTCKPPPPSSSIYLHHNSTTSRHYRQKESSSSSSSSAEAAINLSGRGLSVRSYMEDSNTLSGFANKVIGALPVIGLFARIISDEGGVGGDIIDFAEFRRRVGKKCTVTDSRAFYEFQDRRGRAGDPLYVLHCCWLAAVGAGYLKSEEILEGVSRLSLSNDIEFEEQTFIAMMNEARERRAKTNAAAPIVPMEIRAEKALEAIYVCCFGRDPIEEEDERLLCTILSAVFPTVKESEIQRIISDKARRIAEGTDGETFPEPTPLSKEAVQMQMKDLQFLQQNRDT